MKATELRIGNYFQWIEIASMGIGVDVITKENHYAYEKFKEPIPLTEEWLKRFEWNPPKDIAVSFSLTTDEIHFVAGNYYKKIEYVHQLQNLYFALTGQELNQNKEDETIPS